MTDMTKRATRQASSTRNALLTLALAATSFWVGGCAQISEIVPPGAFDRVNAAFEELDLDETAEIVSEHRYGGNLVGDGPAYLAIIAGTDVAPEVEDRLSDLGYDYDPTLEVWQRGSADEIITVGVGEIAPGDDVSVGDGLIETADESGAVVIVRGV